MRRQDHGLWIGFGVLLLVLLGVPLLGGTIMASGMMARGMMGWYGSTGNTSGWMWPFGWLARSIRVPQPGLARLEHASYFTEAPDGDLNVRPRAASGCARVCSTIFSMAPTAASGWSRWMRQKRPRARSRPARRV
jgi:hypothetical protein